MKRRVIVFTILAALCLASVAAAATFSGKVVGITDGDTITVLVNRAPVKVRLYGIDCPESHQAYGTQAKKATSALAFGKVVFVEAIDRDRYGRTVGVVTLPGKVNLNQELVKQGMAWWYRQYAPSSRDLPKLEDQARKAKIGLWSQPNPIPPWDFRKGGSTPAAIAPAPSPAQAPAQPAANADTVYVTAKGKAYHTATCPDLTNSKTKHPIPRSEAISRGYRPCKTCKPDTGTGQAGGRQ